MTELTTGWEPDLPLDDTLLRRFLYAWAESLSEPVAALGGHVARTAGYVLTDLGRPAAYFNGAVLLRPLDGETLDAIEKTLGHGYLWSLWPTPDLRSRGWELEGHPPILIRPPGAALPPERGVDVRPVTGAAELADWERVMVDGYPFDELRPWRKGALCDERVLRTRLRLWLAYDADRPVGAAASYTACGLHLPVLAATLPEVRHRGFWQALLRTRLLAAGEAFSAGFFSDHSRRGAERSGFLPIIRVTLWRRSG